jgi:hypothetical protein
MDLSVMMTVEASLNLETPTQLSRNQILGNPGMIFGVNPLIALGVLASTAATDAAYVFFNAAVTGRRRFRAANWSAIWYLLSAFAVISYTENAIYVLFAASGSWLGAFASVTWLRWGEGGGRGNPSQPAVKR